jgi:hypothetical protein
MGCGWGRDWGDNGCRCNYGCRSGNRSRCNNRGRDNGCRCNNRSRYDGCGCNDGSRNHRFGGNGCGNGSSSGGSSSSTSVTNGDKWRSDSNSLVFLHENGFDYACDGRRNLCIDLVGRYFNEGLVDLDAVTDILEPTGDGSFGNAFAKGGEADGLAHELNLLVSVKVVGK